jgi:hypothetical protein
MDTTLIVPGLHGSGPDHWQSWFEGQIAGSVRVSQSDWSRPDLPRWSARLAREVDRANDPVFIVAHSFGCLAAVDVAGDRSERIAGLMLVAPADPARFGLQHEISNAVLGVHSILVASTNDDWMSIEGARVWADAWGSQLINAGAVGHINVSSGFGPWPRGVEIFQSLRGAGASNRARQRACRGDYIEISDF